MSKLNQMARARSATGRFVGRVGGVGGGRGLGRAVGGWFKNKQGQWTKRRRRGRGITGVELRGFRKVTRLLRRVGMAPKGLRGARVQRTSRS
jgi:hypothetical protein